MVVVPPHHYCVIENPICRDKDGRAVTDRLGQVKLQHADKEIRLTQEPFPLYPGELLKQVIISVILVWISQCTVTFVCVCVRAYAHTRFHLFIFLVFVAVYVMFLPNKFMRC